MAANSAIFSEYLNYILPYFGKYLTDVNEVWNIALIGNFKVNF